MWPLNAGIGGFNGVLIVIGKDFIGEIGIEVFAGVSRTKFLDKTLVICGCGDLWTN